MIVSLLLILLGDIKMRGGDAVEVARSTNWRI